MSEQIREQVSAFLDGELPNSEAELLLKRLTRDVELRDSFGRYALIGESLRGATHAHLCRDFTARVNRTIDGGPPLPQMPAARTRAPHWWRPFAGVAVAACVAVLAVVGLQQRAVAPGQTDAATGPGRLTAQVDAAGSGRLTADNGVAAGSQAAGAARAQEALSYTVPQAVPDAPTAMPAARLTNYVFAHSKYSSGLGQSNMWSGLVSGADAEAAADAAAPRAETPVAP